MKLNNFSFCPITYRPVKCCLRIFAWFSIGLFVFLMMIYSNSLYTLKMNPLLSSSPHSVVCFSSSWGVLCFVLWTKKLIGMQFKTYLFFTLLLALLVSCSNISLFWTSECLVTVFLFLSVKQVCHFGIPWLLSLLWSMVISH